MKQKRQRRHWYRITTTECVLCGSGRTYRERVYGRKPKRHAARFEVVEKACGHHFM